jgi:tetratricopeptide (TPR) repeat protein
MLCYCRVLLLILVVALSSPLLAQDQLGKVIGQLRVNRADFPTHPVLVELQLHFATVNSAYADSQGRFGFYSLEGNVYHVLIKDEAFYPVDEQAIVNPQVSPTTIVQVTLQPRQDSKQSSTQSRMSGSNPYIVDLEEYKRNFPKSAVKEFEKGVDADNEGKKDEAIRYYEKVLREAPDFYPAHNNLGSDYLSKSDLPGARKEFQRVVQLNQSDSEAYFNLGNVCMLMGQMGDAQQYLGEGMRRQPDSALGHFLLGSLDIRTGKYEQAEAALRQAIQLNPVMAQARLQLVNLLVQRGRKADAVAQLHEFVSAFPDSPFTPKARALLQRLESSADGQVTN